MNTHKISFDVFINELSKDWTGLECSFCVDGHPNYQLCWLGKMTTGKVNSMCYWYGLVEDGSQAYDSPTMDAFINAKVFQGKSIKDIWGLISFYCFNGCDVEEWFRSK